MRPPTRSKSPRERIGQAVLFEALAIVLSTVVFGWAMGTTWLAMGLLSLVTSLAAVIWNVVYNAGFDRWDHGPARSVRLRVVHAIGFEVGLMAATLPLGMWWLGLDILTALAFEGSAVLFFVGYTYAFHWAYDTLRDMIAAAVLHRSDVGGD